MAAVIRLTGGNFRLLDLLRSQAARLVHLNGLETFTLEAVNAARG